ncbi:MAG: DUF6567 family protein [Cytophagales bacterium]
MLSFITVKLALGFAKTFTVPDLLTTVPFKNYVSTEAHVQLSKKNFKVVDYVVGESSATYICLIGGLSKKALVEKAKSEMYKNANMVGNAKVILNQTVSFTSEHYPFVRILKCTVSGYVYEFTE